MSDDSNYTPPDLSMFGEEHGLAGGPGHVEAARDLGEAQRLLGLLAEQREHVAGTGDGG